MKLGIGLITHCRRERALATLAALLRHTTTPSAWCVADDGSTDGTADAIRHRHPSIPVLGGVNRGVCHNRNRALWWLHVEQRCDVTLLIEDDTFPTQSGWERDWIDAAQSWGHACFDGAWFRAGTIRGAGTVADPAVSQGVSGQCCAFSREALDVVGFYDSRFAGYGGGHVEHSMRMVRAGFGGELRDPVPASYALHQRAPALVTAPPEPPRALFYLLRSPLQVEDEGSHRSADAVRRARMTLARTVRDPVHRMPWRTDQQMAEFRAEIAAAKAQHAALRLIAA